MMEILVFIFGSFWRWLGATIMLWIIFEGISGISKGMIVKQIVKKLKERKSDE